MKVTLLAAIISVAFGHTHGEHQHEHQNPQNNLRGRQRPLTMPGHRCAAFVLTVWCACDVTWIVISGGLVGCEQEQRRWTTKQQDLLTVILSCSHLFIMAVLKFAVTISVGTLLSRMIFSPSWCVYVGVFISISATQQPTDLSPFTPPKEPSGLLWFSQQSY